jgi:cation transport ATPase
MPYSSAAGSTRSCARAEFRRHSYGKMARNMALAFCFKGLGVPVATTGLVDPG